MVATEVSSRRSLLYGAMPKTEVTMLIRKFRNVKKKSICTSGRLAWAGTWNICPRYTTTNKAGTRNTRAISTLAKKTEEKYSFASFLSPR